MLVLKENQRLYPNTWGYNGAIILTELAKIVINNGGNVKPLKNAIISNSSIDNIIIEYTEKLERYNRIIESGKGNEKTKAAIIKTKNDLEIMQKINNDPVTVTHTSYISFVLDGFYYYYQLDGNPFLEFYYIKTPINNGRYSRDAALMEDPKEWLYDCFFNVDCCNAERVEAANVIFNMLINASESTVIRDKNRRRVPNTYNGGYHYETVYIPERFEKIDF